MWIARPVVCRPEQAQAVEAERLDANDRPRALCVLNPPTEGAIRRWRIVVMATDPLARLKSGGRLAQVWCAHLAPPDPQSVGLNGTEMSALRKQERQGRRPPKPCSDLLRSRADLAQPVLPILSAVEMLTTT